MVKNMDFKNSILISDFSVCTPREALSTVRPLEQWELCPYETKDVSGTMLVSLRGGTPPPVTLSPGLRGPHAIYVCVGAYGQYGSMAVNVKLSGDGAPTLFSSTENAQNRLEESFWKCADLTGQDLSISKFQGSLWCSSVLAWLRFVPLTDEEWEAYRDEQARRDTKRLYATNDMHAILCSTCPEDPEDWAYIFEDYRDSDVKYFSMENIWIFDGPVSTGDRDNLTYFRDCDRLVQHRVERYTDEQMSRLFAYGRKMDFETIFSLRMGFWSIEFPYDQMYFTNQFYEQHPELRCVNRDGARVERMSYAYPEVQDYMLEQFSHMAAFDCDGIEMLWNRGAPYLLFEPPFVEEFQRRHGEDPRLLPLEEPRVQALRCEIMTGFVRRLRERLDRERVQRGQKRLKFVARGLLNLDDNLALGLDFEQWAKEGLIDVVISYQLQIRENLTGDVWQDGQAGLLDLEKYARAVRQSDTALTERIGDFRFVANIETDFGRSFYVPLEERVRQFQRLETLYGVEVFHDIMPRQLSCEEYRRRALELYGCGAQRISLWDSYCRAPARATWSMARRLGHQEELPGYDSGEGTLWQNHRLLSVRGINVSVYPPNWG